MVVVVEGKRTEPEVQLNDIWEETVSGLFFYLNIFVTPKSIVRKINVKTKFKSDTAVEW